MLKTSFAMFAILTTLLALLIALTGGCATATATKAPLGDLAYAKSHLKFTAHGYQSEGRPGWNHLVSEVKNLGNKRVELIALCNGKEEAIMVEPNSTFRKHEFSPVGSQRCKYLHRQTANRQKARKKRAHELKKIKKYLDKNLKF